jgi:hypothetical protein
VFAGTVPISTQYSRRHFSPWHCSTRNPVSSPELSTHVRAIVLSEDQLATRLEGGAGRQAIIRPNKFAKSSAALLVLN